jgi:predicted CXXCH cytochrome family protein
MRMGGASACVALAIALSVAGDVTVRAAVTADQCVGCHSDELETTAATGGHSPLVDCNGCHADRRPGRVGRRHRAIPNCADCHTEPTGHPPRAAEPHGRRATRNCLGCHAVHGSPNLHLIRTDIIRRGVVSPIAFTSEEGAAAGGFTDPADPGHGLCETCHRHTDFYVRNGSGKPHFTVTCTDCHAHDAHFQVVVTDANCAICHTDEAARFAKPSGHQASFAACSGCHAPGAAATPGPGHRAIEACQTCHPANATHAPMGPPGFPCTQCHDPHGTDNARLVLDVLTTPSGTQVPIRFDNLLGRVDGSFASASAPGTGVCEVCHTTTKFYRADGSGDPHFTFSCLPCHLHAAGFAPP